MMTQIIAMFVACLGNMFLFGDWRVCLVVLGLFPIMMTAFMMAAKSAIGAPNQPAGNDGDVVEKTDGSLIGEVVTGIRTVASFNVQSRFLSDYMEQVEKHRLEAMGRACKVGLLNGFACATIYLIMAIELFYGLWLQSIGAFGTVDTNVYDEPPSSGCRDTTLHFITKVLVPISSLQMVMMQISLVTSVATDATASKAAAEELFERLDRETRCDPLSSSGEQPQTVEGHIEVRDVVFAYPSRPTLFIAKGYNLKITAGTVCALCGPSGSGKSTLVALLQRFYDPIHGQVLLDGHDITMCNVSWLRQQFGMVGQEPVLFMGTVAENIANGKVGGAAQEEILAAAMAANAHDFITKELEDGYHTQVGWRGERLSGGQKQRVAIARAIVREPRVMLLDEATSALDNEGEQLVQAALDKMMRGRTTIVIAHRLSTIRNANKIAVISQGVVKEEGTHDELLKSKNGVYFGMVKATQG